MAKVLLISHEPQAAPALIGEILAERGHESTLHVVLEDPDRPNTAFPDPTPFDIVVAFGSFANAYDPRASHWVDPEVAYLEHLVAIDKPYLGVCFGGQLLARALGGYVEKAPEGSDEIGLVRFDTEHHAIPAIPAGPWFTWHEDRYVLPDDVEVLARNEHAVQLYRKGRAVGTQFHPEADIDTVSSWVRVGGDHVPAHTTGAAILAELQANEAQLRVNCERLVDWFLVDVAGLQR